MRLFFSLAKKQLITLFGFRTKFPLFILGHRLLVGYDLRLKRADRDYELILQLANNKRCIFDVGANHGIISLLLASSNPQCQIHAFEASEDAVNRINDNVVRNDFQKVIKVVNALIADRSGYVLPFYWEGSSGGASVVKGRLGHNTEIYKATLSLDDYAFDEGCMPDFIKMDIEGAENFAIEGLQRILIGSRPDVFVELHDFKEKKLFQNAQDILSFISPLDYLMIYLRTGEIVTDCDVLRSRGRCHVLLLPRERYVSSVIEAWNLEGL